MHILTVPLSLRFLRGQVGLMRERGFDVHVVTTAGDDLDRFLRDEPVTGHAVEMLRRVAPLHDIVAIVRLMRRIASVRPQIVHAHTPKGGLLGMTSAWLMRVPVRIYHMRGLPYTTAQGWKRLLLRTTERISCALAHRVISVSSSLRAQAIADGIVRADKVHVMAGGSGNGVDAQGRYSPAAHPPMRRVDVRARLGIPQDALVIGFVGRVARDKGIVELESAWRTLRDRFPAAHLVIVGGVEANDTPPAAILASLDEDSRTHQLGELPDVADLYPAFDLLALPTYREGFPNVLLEAGAMELPVVATRVPGCVDAVIDGETGVLVEPRSAESLATALGAYLSDGALRRAHGRAARRHVTASFAREVVWEAIHAEYLDLLADRGVTAPNADTRK